MKTHKEINNRNTVTSFYKTIDSANPDISQIAGASNIYIGNHEDAPKTADFVIEEDIHTNTLESNDNTYHIEDAIKSNLVNFEIDGKSIQETRSGKNLLHINSGSQTKNGVTVTNNNDGTITVNGTCTAAVDIWFANGTSYLANDYANSFVIGDKFTLRQNIISGTSTGNWAVRVILYNTSTQEVFWMVLANDMTYTATFNGETRGVELLTATGNTFNNLVLFPQLERGATATTPEQFGVMPSPDYPSEIESVGYENLINLNGSIIVQSGVSSKNFTNDTYTATSTSGKSYKYILYEIGDISDYLGKTMSIGVSSLTNTQENYGIITLCAFNSSSPGSGTTTYVSLSPSKLQGFSQITTPASGRNKLGFLIYMNVNIGSDANTITFKDLIITIGDKKHSYIPYGKYGIEYKTVGKNLLDKSTNIDGYYINASGVISSNNKLSNYTDLIPVNQGTYTISGTHTYSGSNIKRVHGYDKDGNWLLQIKTQGVGSAGDYNFNFNINDENIKYIRFSYYTSDENVQIEQGSPTPYEPYKEQTQLITLDEPLRSLPNGVRDKLRIENNTLYVDRYVGRIILNGSESNWNYNSTYLAFQIPISNVTTVSERQYRTMSSHFAPARSTTAASQMTSLPDYSCALRGGYSNLIIKNSDYTSTTDLKNWLSTHNTEVIYQLAEKQTIDLGPINLYIIEGVNNIEILANLLLFDTTLTYQISPNARLFKRQEDGTLKEVFANEN